ncbi:MAG TPA: peptidoglycan-associated lipoprotein Pal [Chloroflexota bacterium]|nr:peptidoglycan-associated lipoprotein Pal [Chloroflexota bacterium]
MTFSRAKGAGYTLTFFLTLIALGCHKNTAAPPPPPPPPAAPPAASAPAPTITLRAQPSTIDRGGSTTLQWDAKNATSVAITPGVGNVAVTGNQSVNPTSSVTYTATAMGPGGTATDTARITVNVPSAGATTPTTRPTVNASPLDQFKENVKTIYFDYDKADIKPDQVSTLQSNAAWLKANPNVRFTIEGHCDERGSEEYNLGLGDRRANAVKEFLAAQGIPANRMMTVSYGEERPVCRETTEECYGMNRRAAFTLNQ